MGEDALIKWIRANGGVGERLPSEDTHSTPEPPPDGGPRATALARWLGAQTRPVTEATSPVAPKDDWLDSLSPLAAEQARVDPEFARDLYEAAFGIERAGGSSRRDHHATSPEGEIET